MVPCPPSKISYFKKKTVEIKSNATRTLVFCGFQGLWVRLLKLGSTEDPLSSFEYGTILGMFHCNGNVNKCTENFICKKWLNQGMNQIVMLISQLLTKWWPLGLCYFCL